MSFGLVKQVSDGNCDIKSGSLLLASHSMRFEKEVVYIVDPCLISRQPVGMTTFEH